MSDPSRRRDFLNPLKAIQAFREESTEPSIEVPPPNAADLEDTDENGLLFVSKDAMACNFQIYFSPTSGNDITETAIEALESVEQLENQMTVYRSSPVTYLNERAAAEPVRLEKRLFALIQKGVELYHKTQGAFDMTSGLLTKAWGFFRQEGRVPDPAEIQTLLEAVGSDKVQLDSVQETVFYSNGELEINLGGIGKGHALDRVAEFMTNAGVENFLIHGGQSSVLARGIRWKHADESQQAMEPWKVGLRHPIYSEKRIAELTLNGKALGTSGTARQSFYHQGKRYGHIIDPRTGYPAEGVFSATAIAATAAEADALATAFYVMGGEQSVQFCEQHPDYACLVLSATAAGELHIDQSGIPENEITFF
ncbi:MAG: FAD:protein FMN transferase [Planctomycetota bacterium]|nr:FAD:protein FMN transferase [Planctomycetota bacterium]